jgi:hypothetical protein
MSFINREPLSGAALRDVRRARLVRATLRFASGVEIPVVVRNLSERGLGVSCRTAPPARGEAVTVILPGSGEIGGVVRWTRDTTFGLELTGKVDPADIASALQREAAQGQEAGDWVVSRRHRVVAPPSYGPRRRV